MQETWKKIHGYKNYYVSNYGRIKTKDYNHTGEEKQVSVFKNVYGYMACNLMEGGVRKRKLVHRLVAQAFHSLSEFIGATVNHIDGNKCNNFYQNLEWMSVGDNIRHAHEIGLTKTAHGETHYKAKLSTIDVIEIRKMLALKVKGREIASKFNISEKTVSAIKRNKTRIHEQV
jgi:hypothetical protein